MSRNEFATSRHGGSRRRASENLSQGGKGGRVESNQGGARGNSGTKADKKKMQANDMEVEEK